MIGINVKTSLDGVEKKLSDRADDAIRALEIAVISSCEPYVPYDTGKKGYYNIPKFKDGTGVHLAIGYPF